MPNGGGTRLLIPALGRQRQVDFCDFKASLVYEKNYGRTAASQELREYQDS